MRNSTRAVLLAFALALGLWLAYLLRASLMLIYVSIVFAVVLTPAVEAVQRLRIRNWSPSRGIAILLIISGTLLALVLFFMLAVPPIVDDIQRLAKDLPEKFQRWRTAVQDLPFGLGNQLKLENLEKYLGAIVGGASGFIAGTFSLLATLITALLLTAYFILDGERAFEWGMSLFPQETQSRLEPALRRAAAGMRKWLVGQGILMLVLGVASVVAFGLLRVRYFFVLAVLAGVANIIPLLGPVITVVLAAAVAAIDSWLKVVGVLVFYFVYQQLENSYLTPRIMESQLDIPATAILIALLIGAELAGTAGALVAVPSAVLVSALLDEYVVQRRKEPAPQTE